MNENELKLDRYEEEIDKLRRTLEKIRRIACGDDHPQYKTQEIFYIADEALTK